MGPARRNMEWKVVAYPVPEVKGFAFGVLVDEKHETKRDGTE